MSQGKRYRLKVRAHVIDAEQNLLVVHCGKHIGPDWEVPGGGIRQGETAAEALERELYEEVGIRYFQVIGHVSKKFYEHFAPEVLTRLKLDYVGQEIEDFVIAVDASRPVIIPIDGEVTEYRWIPLDKVKDYLNFDIQFEVFCYLRQYMAAAK